LYKKITDNADQVLDKLNNNNESFNTLKSSSDSKRSGRKHRSADNSYMDQDADKNHLVSDMQNDNNSSYPQQVNNQAREAINIMKEVDSSLKEVNKIAENLETIKQILDNIKDLADTAKSYLENARRDVGSSNPALLPSLGEAIAKVKSSHASLNVCYTDAFNASKNAKDHLEHAQSKAKKALEEALKAQPLGYTLYYTWISDTKTSMSSAKSNLETAKNKQEELKKKIDQANAELEELNKAHKAALKSTES
ncbi:hypothetical protein, partial [Borrelia sp. A-FGy1]|uniref:hypothetical protein n=1 Tax=Borrelia sp. A-FGy1 TaxID=2608247 RepID=UPI0015F5E095